jgi:hypothetical protein
MNDAVTADAKATPEPGDVFVCIHCAEVSVYGDNRRQRKPLPGEIVATDPQYRKLVMYQNAIREMIAQRTARAMQPRIRYQPPTRRGFRRR